MGSMTGEGESECGGIGWCDGNVVAVGMLDGRMGGGGGISGGVGGIPLAEDHLISHTKTEDTEFSEGTTAVNSAGAIDVLRVV